MALSDMSQQSMILEEVAVAANLDWATGHVGHNTSSTLDLGSVPPTQLKLQYTKLLESREPLVKFIRLVPHLYMLGQSELEHLVAAALRREYCQEEVVLDRGLHVGHVHVVMRGSIDVFVKVPACGQGQEVLEDRVTTIEAGNVFGFENVMCKENSRFCYRAGTTPTEVILIPEKVFCDVACHNVCVAQSIGRKIAEHMNIFHAIKEFCRVIFSHEVIKYEYLPVTQILDCYSRLHNGIHAKARSSEVDVGAWMYAIRRLPDNVTTTFCFDLARSLPPFMARRLKEVAKQIDVEEAQEHNRSHARQGEVKFIHTKARRRCAFQIGLEGKTIVLLRDGFTDMLDFVSCLCIHIFEANKLRARLNGIVEPPAVDILDEALYGQPEDERSMTQSQLNDTGASGCFEHAPMTKEKIDGVLNQMPLTTAEKDGLKAIWGDQVIKRLSDVFIHREEYMLRVDSSLSRRFQADPFHEWALGIRSVILSKLKLPEQSPLPMDLVVDVMSSNTHGTKNCLSPWPRVYYEQILEFAKKHRPEIYNMAWNNTEDMIYFLIPAFLKQHPELEKEKAASLKMAEIEVMRDTALTGLQVDIIPVSGIQKDLIDTALVTSETSKQVTPMVTPCRMPEPPSTISLTSPNNTDVVGASSTEDVMNFPSSSFVGPVPDKSHFIVNMDFAFGAQADGITRALVTVFGHRIRSFSVMGKAGGLVGERGDIQFATHVLQSKSSLTTDDCLDELRSCGNQDLTADRLRELCPDRSVHVGPVLTIAGTLLQNNPMLHYYKNIWNCVGVEMEGSHFARQLLECRKMGLVRPDLITRFAYYTSDMPLADATGSGSLAKPMSANEGVPSTYAITRAFLEQMLRPAVFEEEEN